MMQIYGDLWLFPHSLKFLIFSRRFSMFENEQYTNKDTTTHITKRFLYQSLENIDFERD